MKNIRITAIAALIITLTATTLHAAEFEIRIPFQKGAKAVAVREGYAPTEIGKVIKIPSATRYPAYTASAWGKESAVCATAVNALHILVSFEKGHGRTISIIPQETIAPAAKAGTSFILSAKAGTACFGAWTPPVGTEVVLRNEAGEERKLSAEKFIQPGETLVIKVKENCQTHYVEIENRPGGRVIELGNKGCVIIGRVIRPLAGTGRFQGTKFQGRGMLRANHPGVIDYSTSKIGTIGGFQIIPWDHALTSTEMQGAWAQTQWLIIGPADGKSPMGGTSPLFDNSLIPGVNRDQKEELWDLWSTIGRQSPLRVRINGGPWQEIPETAGKQDRALEKITHLRIYYPTTE